MSEIFTAACVQLNSGNDMTENLNRAEALIAEAAEKASFIALPENAAFMAASRDESLAHAFPENEHPALKRFCELAKRYEKWLLIGSLSVASLVKNKALNRSYLINAEGEVAAFYDKIHLYDATLPNGEIYRESERITPGNQAVVADLPWATLGLTICYDVRFPHLFRSLAKAGASMITVPAAFTQTTGEAHWHVLLRARAIETGCFIIAPGMCGLHPGNRRTYGHSLIVDPWGNVLIDGGTEEGVSFAEIDLSLVNKARTALPCLKHDRKFSAPEA